MKKLFVLFAVIGICTLAYSQDVKVTINNQDATAKDDCPYRINGICATEDIGGVDVDILADSFSCGKIRLTNYNNFAVTVLFMFNQAQGYNYDDYYNQTASVVIRANGTKDYSYTGNKPHLKGIIVRKIAQ